MWKKIFFGMLAFAFPWAVLLAYDNPGGAIVALVMQASVIGWIPATMWAWNTIYHSESQKKN